MAIRRDYRWESRPDGVDEAAYKLRGWTKRRVAWEFLRRSKRYQRVCNEIYNSERGEVSDISPAEYGYRIPLRNLVDYTCDWEEAKECLEFFSRASVVAAAGRGGLASDDEGCVTFRIDLESMLSNRALLELRLIEIRRECEKRLAGIAKHRRKGAAARRFRAGPLSRSLRYLDLRASGKSSAKIGKLLYGVDQSAKNRSRALDKDRKRARLMLKRGLRDLIISVLIDPEELLAVPREAKAEVAQRVEEADGLF